MSTHRIFGARTLGMAAATALAVGMATTGHASADAPPASASVTDSTLSVIGTSAADRIALRLAAGNSNILQVDFNDDGSSDQSFDRTTFNRIEVSLGNGDDHFRVDQVNGSFTDEALVVDGGNGDDTILGGDGNEVLLGGNGNDTIDGNKGTDSADLGTGQDAFIWDPGDGSDRVDGGEGKDTLVFNGADGAENMSLSANGQQAVFLRDPGSVRMDLDNIETVDVAAKGGADIVTINDMTGTSVREANVDLSSQGAGDHQVDDVTVNGSTDAENIRVGAHGDRVDVDGFAAQTHITGSETTDLLHVNGRGGRDSARVDGAVSGLISTSVTLA